MKRNDAETVPGLQSSGNRVNYSFIQEIQMQTGDTFITLENTIRHIRDLHACSISLNSTLIRTLLNVPGSQP